MGLTVSIGKDNDELIDNLVGHDSVKTEQIEKIMRLVDRGVFMPESARENAYKDSAWKSETGEPGFLHISAPCIYASVLENLDLKKGMSFLNIGSGTGYMSAMVGFVLGETGVNHGVELYENIVKFANERIIEIQNYKETSAFEWCVPKFLVGNAFQIETQIQYDRIYCGALVPESHRAYFCSFLKIGGILIMPYGHALHRIVRISEREFRTRDVSAVTFSHLIPVNPENSLTNKPVQLSSIEFPSLQSICRKSIRQMIRSNLLQTNKIEMRVISTNKRNQQPRPNGDENEHSDRESDQDELRPPRQRDRPRLFPHFVNNRVVIIEGERHERGRENDDDNPLPNRPHVMPVRQLLALFARDRIHRHHAARARQAAEQVHTPETESGDSDEDEERTERHHNGPAVQLYTAPDDNNFGYQFIPEREIDDNDDIHIVTRHILEDDHSDTDDDHRNDTGNDQSGQTTEFDERMDPNDAVVDPENDYQENVARPSDVTTDDEYKNSNNEESDATEPVYEDQQTSSLPSDSSSYETAKSDVVEQNSSNDGNSSDQSLVESVNRASNSTKRQRTFTATLSEGETQAIKTKRKCTNGIEFNDAEKLSKNDDSSQENFGESGSECHADVEIDSSEGSSKNTTIDTSDLSFDGCSTSTPISTTKSNVTNNTKDADVKEVTSEEQAQLLENFHKEFIKRIDGLPLTPYVRKFLKYEL